MTRLPGLSLLALAAALTAAPAAAAVEVCNQSSDAVFLATGFDRADERISTGWLTLRIGECVTLRLDGATIYVYAENLTGEVFWTTPEDGQGGDFCVNDGSEDFTIPLANAAADCGEEFPETFIQVDDGETFSFTDENGFVVESPPQ
jgi:uncharacterized membrane protein